MAGTLNRRGNLKLKAGGRVKKLLGIFASPVQPELKDYYEPWTYDYQTLVDAPLGDDFPVARPKSLITGEDTKITWSANWDDNLGGASEMGHLDPIVEQVRRESEDKINFELEQTFMFYLPRICEHCLNPSCMASCPSGAIYKRAEDGIVLVDQDRCRGWRQCITGCPYKKIYFNHKTGKAEKCTFCYPRIEVGLPTVCSETCVGRLRYLGLFLYDADRGHRGAATPGREGPVRGAAGPDPRPRRPGRRRGGPRSTASRRTGWTRPGAPRSTRWPRRTGRPAAAPGVPHHADGLVRPAAVPHRRPARATRATTPRTAANLFGAIDALRIPVEYLAELFTAGDTDIVTGVLQKLAAMRSYMRDVTLGRDGRPESIPAAGRDDRQESLYEMYRLHGDRQVRRPLRHPQRPRRAGARARGDRLLAGLRRGSGHVRVRPVRRGQRPAGPGRRGDLPRAEAAADRPTSRSRRRRRCAAGSTCSTGTATAHRTGCSRARAGTEGHA